MSMPGPRTVLMVYMYVAFLREVKSYFCSTPDKDADLKFTKELQTLAIGCDNRYTKLHCCATGYTSLIWQQYDETKSRWVLWSDYYTWSPQRRMEGPDNQTFVIESFRETRDEGRYRCVVVSSKNPQHNITNTVDLEAAPCFKWDMAPRVLLPSRRFRQQLAGYNISIPCKGLMGMCDQQDPRERRFCRRYSVTWYKMELLPSGQVTYQPINKTASSRVYQTQENGTEWNDPNRTFMSRTLYITDLQEEDYGVYECQLMNRKGKTKVNVTLAEGFEGEIRERVDYKPNWTNTVIILATIATAGVLLGLLYYYFRYEIKLFLRDKFAKRPNDGLQYDVFLLYNDDSETDSQFVRTTIYPYLRDQCGYSVYRAEMDFPLPSVRAECYVHAVDMCRAVVLVTSPDMISHEWCEFAFHYAITRAKRDMIYLAYRSIPSDFWNDHQRALKAANRMGKRVKWPEKKSSRKLTRFWTQLRYYIPVAPPSTRHSDSCGISACLKQLPVLWRLRTASTTNSNSLSKSTHVTIHGTHMSQGYI